MSLSHRVKIIIENINSDDVISYPLLFIKGTVKCENCDTLFNGIIRLFDDKSFESEFQVSEGKFKVLQELEIGVNNVRLAVNFGQMHIGEESLRFKRTDYHSSNILKALYFIPKGDLGKFQAKTTYNTADVACKKIYLGIKLLQTLIAERLYEEGFGRKSFTCDGVCTVFQSKKYSKEDLIMAADSETIWTMTAKELLEEGIITQNVKVLAFLSCTRYCNESKTVKALVAAGRGNFAMLGAANLHSWPSNLAEVHPCLSSQVAIDSNLFDDSGFRGTMGGCFATSLGSAAHELGHLFDLVHSDYGIMARGFEDIDLFFTVNSSPVHRQSGIAVNSRNSAIVTSFASGNSDRNCVKYNDGRARFHRSAAILLAGHKWLTLENNEPNKGSIIISGLEIKAPNGLRLIELISPNADLLKFWDFTKNPFRLHRFCLNVLDVRISKNGLPPSVQVQDCRGEILRKDLIS